MGRFQGRAEDIQHKLVPGAGIHAEGADISADDGAALSGEAAASLGYVIDSELSVRDAINLIARRLDNAVPRPGYAGPTTDAIPDDHLPSVALNFLSAAEDTAPENP